jgi:hypothetical protein
VDFWAREGEIVARTQHQAEIIYWLLGEFLAGLCREQHEYWTGIFFRKSDNLQVCVFGCFMLNFYVAMNQITLLISVVVSFLLVGPFQQTAQQVVVDSPRPGEALQGNITISGTVPAEGFESYEVSFSYQHDTTNTWFLIEQGKEAVTAGQLAAWDTTTISDGTYRIRVTTFLKDGKAVQSMVTGLRVRNYTAVETPTPAPVNASGTEIAVTPLAADYKPVFNTPTPSPENVAEVTKQALTQSLMGGGLIALGLFVVLGLYLGARALFRRG